MDTDYRRDSQELETLTEDDLIQRSRGFESPCVRLLLIAAAIGLIGCDDEDRDAQWGGKGSSGANDVVTSGNGFCDPTGGAAAVGAASYTSDSTAKLDLDGMPNGSAVDPSWNAQTSGTVDGQFVDASKFNYVVMSPTEMAQDGVSLGDWAHVRNDSTGAAVWARVEDRGPSGGSGEISIAAAHNLGIGTEVVNGNTITTQDVNVSVFAYGGTSGIQGDCPQSL